MHMADALVSPIVGGTMWAASAATVAVSSRRVQQGTDDRRIPLMGVLGAFVFAAQMVNFQLPGTGSSGHLGGALLLAILLGPHAAFLVVVSILAIQALLFGDGGLLALGCNAFNMGFFPAFVAYPLVYRPLAPAGATPARRLVGAIAAAEVGLALGAFGVVFETTLSGISDLPFRPFLTAMIPIHLAIGLVEGAVTAGVLTFVLKTRPDVVDPASSPAPTTTSRLGAAFLAAALLVGGVLSWFASTKPDGLEWSIAKVTGRAGPVEPGATRAATSLAGIGGGLATLALSAGDSPLHRLDPRAKLVTTLAFAAVIASFPKTAVLPLLPFALFPVVLAAAGGVPFGYLARRLLLILPFAILVGAFNPLLDRAPILVGPFSVAEGWISFLSILLRFVLTVSAAIVLVAVTGIHGLCGAMEKLGVPRALVTQLLVLYRYLFVLLDEAGRMDRARALRSFGRRGQGISAVGPFLGTLLVRTWGRAERIHLAMLSRGFDGSFRFDRPLRFGSASILFTAGWLALFALFRSVNVPLALSAFLAGGGL